MKIRAGSAIAAGVFVVAVALGCQDERAPELCADPTATASSALGSRCFPTALTVDEGRVPCRMYAMFSAGSADCDCARKGYAPVEQPHAIYDLLEQRGDCEAVCCADRCFCEFLQLEHDELAACQDGTDARLDPSPVGWCYVSPEQGAGSEELVAHCASNERRILRIVPFRHNLQAVLVCQSELITLEADAG